MKQKHIVLVDDDKNIRRLVASALEKNGYGTTTYESGEEILDNLDIVSPDAVILDIMLPGINGLEVLRKIRENPLYRHLPLIMLTGKDSETETVLGLEIGADDYLSKPVRCHELLARLKKLLQKSDMLHEVSTSTLSIHGIEIDLMSRTVRMGGSPVSHTHMEYELLLVLARHPGRVFSREHLLNLVWEEGQYFKTRTVDVHIRRLRKKIEESGLSPLIIDTVRSVGYRMLIQGPTDASAATPAPSAGY